MQQKASHGTEAMVYANQLAAITKAKRQVAETWHQNWLIRAYFGPSPESTPEMATVEYSACAITMNVGEGPAPDLSGMSRAIRVDFDLRSVLWLSADTRSQLTRKLKSAFEGFEWGPQGTKAK